MARQHFLLPKQNKRCAPKLLCSTFLLLLCFTSGVAESDSWRWMKDTAQSFKCYFTECCGHPFVKTLNSLALAENLQNAVYGQHILQEVLVKQIYGHLKDPDPTKALVLSFNGWTGGGKNLVAKIIAESLYERGMESSFVHQFIGSLDFPGNNPSLARELQKKIEAGVAGCERSLFIFDEVDKMPVGLLDAIKPYLDYHKDIKGVNYRKAIFVLLSNAGGKAITQFVYQKWREGVPRAELKYTDFEEMVQKGVFNEVGGYQKTALVEYSLITLYVPFLPLEKSHVKMCARDAFLRRSKADQVDKIGIKDISKGTEKDWQTVAGTLIYWPPEHPVYSTTGCKRVQEKVNFYLSDSIFDTDEVNNRREL